MMSRKAHEEHKARKAATQLRLKQHAIQVNALRDIFSLIDEDRDGIVTPVDLYKVLCHTARTSRAPVAADVSNDGIGV